MPTKTQTKEVVTEYQEDAINSLRITLDSDFSRFNICVAKMEGALIAESDPTSRIHAYGKYQEALQRLATIEDAIKRFREGRKQQFEED